MSLECHRIKRQKILKWIDNMFAEVLTWQEVILGCVFLVCITSAHNGRWPWERGDK